MSCVALLIAASALAGSPAEDASSGKADSERVECRQEMITGTRFTRRICMKSSDWKTVAERAQQDFKETQDNVRNCVQPNGQPC